LRVYRDGNGGECPFIYLSIIQLGYFVPKISWKCFFGIDCG